MSKQETKKELTETVETKKVLTLAEKIEQMTENQHVTVKRINLDTMEIETLSGFWYTGDSVKKTSGKRSYKVTNGKNTYSVAAAAIVDVLPTFHESLTRHTLRPAEWDEIGDDEQRINELKRRFAEQLVGRVVLYGEEEPTCTAIRWDMTNNTFFAILDNNKKCNPLVLIPLDGYADGWCAEKVAAYVAKIKDISLKEQIERAEQLKEQLLSKLADIDLKINQLRTKAEQGE